MAKKRSRGGAGGGGGANSSDKGSSGRHKHPSHDHNQITHTHTSLLVSFDIPTISMSMSIYAHTYIHTPTHIHTALGVALGVKSCRSKSALTSTHALDAPTQSHAPTQIRKRGRNTPSPHPPSAATTTTKRPRNKKNDDYEDAYQNLLARTKGQAQSQAFHRHEQAKKKHILTHGKRYVCIYVGMCVYIYSVRRCVSLPVHDD